MADMNETKAKAFELRDLTADDMFPMFQIISKIGIKEFKSCFESEGVKKAVADLSSGKGKRDESAMTAIGVTVAVDVAGILISHIGEAKEDIYCLLSNLSGMKRDEIAALPMGTFVQMVVAVIKKDEFKDFFQDVAELFK